MILAKLKIFPYILAIILGKIGKIAEKNTCYALSCKKDSNTLELPDMWVQFRIYLYTTTNKNPKIIV